MLEVNQYIDVNDLPNGAILLSSFPDLNLPQKAGTTAYYKLLENNKDTSPSLQQMLEGNANGESNGYDDHSTWEEFDSLSEADKKLVQKQFEYQLKEVTENIKKNRGNIPGEFAELINKLYIEEPPKFDWKGYMRRFVGNSTISYTKKLRKKYNKRYTMNPGLKIKFKNHILVAIDTSGSVSTNELVEFIKEIHHMHKTGHMITLAQCDTRLTSVKPFKPKEDIKIVGRGGTSFEPVIEHFNAENKYTALIYLTDGEASAPSNCPKNILWVLSSQSNMTNHLPGKIIQLN